MEKKVEVELPEDLPERVLLENLEEYEEYDLSNEEALSDEDEEEEEEEEHEPPTPLSTTSDSHLFTPHPHIFAIGDAADSFGAINAGHNAYFQADIAAKNILKLVMQRRVVEQAGERVVHVHEGGGGVRLSDNEALSEDEEGEEEEEDIWEMVEYTPGPPAIKVSLGLVSFSSFPPHFTFLFVKY